MLSEIERDRCGWELADMADQHRSRTVRHLGEGAQRDCRTGLRSNVNVLQISRMVAELRLHFQDDVILVQLSKESRYLPLPERVVKSIVDTLGGHADTHRGLTIDIDSSLQSMRLKVARDVGKLRNRLQTV